MFQTVMCNTDSGRTYVPIMSWHKFISRQEIRENI